MSHYIVKSIDAGAWTQVLDDMGCKYAEFRSFHAALDLCDQLNGLRPKRVILESPFGSDDEAVVARNIRYARAALRDSLLRDEAPMASHLLYTQAGVLKDRETAERTRGIQAGLAWGPVALATVVYTDLGVTDGMELGRKRAVAEGRTIEHRELGGVWDTETPIETDVAAFLRTLKAHWSARGRALSHMEQEWLADSERLLGRLEGT